MNRKLILHIPHAGTSIPDKTGYIVSDDVLEREKLLLTDWYTDDLFAYDNATTVKAEFNRIFCDVERFVDDDREIMSGVGMGMTYTKLDNGNDLRTVSNEQKKEILKNYYLPHHLKLSKAVDQQLSTDGNALIIDCHSFSSKPFRRDLNQQLPRPDICIGTDDFHTPRGLFKYLAVCFKFQGYTVGINNPYAGSIVPMKYYKKDKRVSTVMIEINRDLYLIPGTNEKNENYLRLKSDLKNYLNSISRLSYFN